MTACKRAAMVLVAALALQSEIVQAFRAAGGVAIAPQSPRVCAQRGVWRGADGRHHRAAWGLPRGMCNPNTARSCEALDVDVVSATEQMFGSLAALRVSELEQHFDGMSLREAELLEMQKDFQEAPGATNLYEMLKLNWLTQEVYEERLLTMQRAWAAHLASGEYRAVVGAVDVQQLSTGNELPLPGLTRGAGDVQLFYICNMVVHEKMRGLGIGRKLLAEALAHARASGGKRVCLQVRHDNTAGQRLYRSAGFHEVTPDCAEEVLSAIHANVETTDAHVCDLLSMDL